MDRDVFTSVLRKQSTCIISKLREILQRLYPKMEIHRMIGMVIRTRGVR